MAEHLTPDRNSSASDARLSTKRDSVFSKLATNGSNGHHHGLYGSDTSTSSPATRYGAKAGNKFCWAFLESVAHRCFSGETAKVAGATIELQRKWLKDIRDYFELHGTRLTLEPGMELSQVEDDDCMFYVLEGEVVEMNTRGSSANGNKHNEFSQDSLLNPECFLMGLPPTTQLVGSNAGASFKHHKGFVKGSHIERSVAGSHGSFHLADIQTPDHQTGGDASNGEVNGAVVARLTYDQVCGLMSIDPKRTRRFFVSLAAGLSQRLETRGKEIKSAIRSLGSHVVGEGSNSADTITAQSDYTVEDIAELFELPEPEDTPFDEQLLLAYTKCLVSIEMNSELEWNAVPARLFLLSSYLCIERLVPVVSAVVDVVLQRRHVATADILGIMDTAGSDDTRGAEPIADERVIIVQMKQGSISLNLRRGDYSHIMRELEIARMAATDSSNLKDEVEEQRVSHWVAVRNSLHEVRGGAMNIGEAAKSLVRKARHSFVSTGSGLTPRQDTIQMVMENALPQHKAQSARKALLSQDEWTTLLSGARYHRWKAGQRIIAAGQQPDGIIQVVTGKIRVEMPQEDRPQALVLGYAGPGDMLGETSLLLGSTPTAEVVCDSEFAMLLRLPRAHLGDIFSGQAEIAAKFFCMVAMRQAAKLRKILLQDASQVEVITDAGAAPQKAHEIAKNPAFMLIFHKFVNSSPTYESSFGSAFSFVQEARMLLFEGSPMALRSMVDNLYRTFIDSSQASRPLTCLGEEVRCLLEQSYAEQSRKSFASSELHLLRHLFDGAIDACLAMLDESCCKSFLKSKHYQYVLNLKSKEQVIPTMDYFRIVRVLGTGGFGQVLEVIKRDCGHSYAMKVMVKKQLEDVFGDDWETMASTERLIMSTLQHPLLVNLAYAFQTIDKLMLVMDACPNGDLAQFGIATPRNPKPRSLTVEQVRFIGMEVVMILLYLHSKNVLYRDMKPENLLLDALGHVRLIDFGVSKQGKEGHKVTSREFCGTAGYMAPEVKRISSKKKPYGVAADWFSFGVSLYEIVEHAMPFGNDPAFNVMTDEFRSPDLLDEDDNEVPGLYDLLAGLLDWNPKGRLDDSNIQKQHYWQAPDWELVGRGKMESPLLSILTNKDLNDMESKINRRATATDESRVVARALAQSESFRKDAEKSADSPERNADSEEREREMMLYHVENWDFVSEQALAQEYVRGAAEVVSAL